MKLLLNVVQILVSALLILSILLQSSGSGFSSPGSSTEHYHTRRGFENVLVKLIVILAILFFTSSIANFLVN